MNDFAVEDGGPPSTDRDDGSSSLVALREPDTLSVRRDPLQQHIADQIVERDYN